MSPGNFFGCGGRDTRKLPSRISLRMALFSDEGFSNHSTHSVASNCGYSMDSTVTFRCSSTCTDALPVTGFPPYLNENAGDGVEPTAHVIAANSIVIT